MPRKPRQMAFYVFYSAAPSTAADKSSQYRRRSLRYALTTGTPFASAANFKVSVCFVWTNDGPKDVEIVDYH